MPEPLRPLIEQMFQSLIATDEVGLIEDDGELHIAADDWTLVLEGDPVSSVMIALDDETGSPDVLLREAISENALAALRDLDASLQGKLTGILANSPDPLARALAGLLTS